MAPTTEGAVHGARHRHARGPAALLRRGAVLSYVSPVRHRWSRWALVALMMLFLDRRHRGPGGAA